MTNDIKNQDLKYRPLVYVASAYSGDVITNIEKAKQYCGSLWNRDRYRWHRI